MTNQPSFYQLSSLPAVNDAGKVIRRLEQSILGGKHWYLALLEAIKIWAVAEETHNGRIYRYLVAGELASSIIEQSVRTRVAEELDALAAQEKAA